MNRREQSVIARLLQRLTASDAARLVRQEDGRWLVCGKGAGRKTYLQEALIRQLAANGLLVRAEPGRLKAGATALAWLARRGDPEVGFLEQHGEVDVASIHDGAGRLAVRVNRAESPVASLRSAGRGKRWLDDAEAEAAERLRCDFDKGQMQPRITSNWSAAVNCGRRAGGGSADVADAAIAARLRVEKALVAVGPEFAGVLTDICCFLKGIETVEHERQWPARSAKLVLKLGLSALARHYGLSATASGTAGSAIRHWGDDDFRPEIS